MKLWQVLFAIASLFNLAIGGAMLAAPERAAAGMGGEHNAYDLQFAGVMIAVFGLGYAMVARDPARNRGIIWIGMLGKLAVVLLSTFYFLNGAFPINAYALAMGDLAFVLAFAAFLWRGPRTA